MKTTIQLTILLFNILLLNPFFGVSQNSQNESPPFEVHQEYPYISVSKQELAEAETLYDLKNKNNNLNLEYKPSWVSKYIWVEIQICLNGELKKARGESNVLTKEQKELLVSADNNKDIQVQINYLPKNNLAKNESKEILFSLVINPENSAKFAGGEEALNQYLVENGINEISATSFDQYDMAAIKFKINAAGKVHQSEIFGAEYQSGKFEVINQTLLEIIRKMPDWQPATYADGTKTDQAFVLTVGSKENCVLPLLNIGR